MIRARVKSSNIVSIGHEPRTNTLEVEFAGGRVYQYNDVNFSEYNRLMNAGSIGKHFAAFIKPFKETRRIDDGERR